MRAVLILSEMSGATSVEFETCLQCWAGFPLILRQSDLCCSRHPLPPLQQQFGSTLVYTLLQISSSTCFSLRLPRFQRSYITMSEAEEYEVETIVSKRLRKGRFRGFELVFLPQHASPQEKLSISSSGRGGRTLTTTPGSPLAILSVT